MNNFQDQANFIWQVADDILRGAFKQHEYGEVTLPFVVITFTVVMQILFLKGVNRCDI